MLINFTNHPSENWPKSQNKAASVYGQISDIPFPSVNPEADETEIMRLANIYVKTINDRLAAAQKNELSAVHIMGELSLCFSIILRLQKLNIKCLCSTTKRIVRADTPGNKVSEFHFHKFRIYEFLK